MRFLTFLCIAAVSGKWSAIAVEQAGKAGGLIGIADLNAWQPLWSDPLQFSYQPPGSAAFEIVGHGLPAVGTVHHAEELNLVELAQVSSDVP